MKNNTIGEYKNRSHENLILKWEIIFMDKKWEILDLLSYNRHDWLNRIQLIKGNLDLGKIDYAKEVIDSIINEAKNEAELSNLQMPKMAELLITSKWQGYPFALEYEVLQARKGCHNVDESMYNWTVAFFKNLCLIIEAFGENELKIEIYEGEYCSRFTFDLQGKIKDKNQMLLFLKDQPLLAEMNIVSFTDEELVFELKWDCSFKTILAT